MPRQNRLPFIRIDENLAKIVGNHEKPIQTHIFIKKMWEYIKSNNLKIKFEDFKGD